MFLKSVRLKMLTQTIIPSALPQSTCPRRFTAGYRAVEEATQAH